MLFLFVVKCWLYALLGTFAEVFPEHMISQSDRLVSIYVNVLKSEVLYVLPSFFVILHCIVLFIKHGEL